MSHQRTQAQPRQGMLNFITFGESPQPTSTRAIRSHAAKAGWKLRKTSRSLASSAQSEGPLLGPIADPAPGARLAQPRHRNLPAVPSWPDHDGAGKIVPSLASSTSISTNSSNSTPSSTYSSHENDMDLMTEDIEPAESGFVCDDDEDDLREVDSHALQFATTDSAHPQSSSTLFPHQLGSSHDPFSQFPVRWEEAFGPLVQFCKYPSCVHLPARSKWQSLKSEF
jgi:hypothetical protein